MLRIVKLTFYLILRGGGAFWFARFMNRKAIVILCYHGISIRDEHKVIPGIFISEEKFSKRLKYLGKHYKVIGLEEALFYKGDKAPPNYRAVITFDDGFYNFVPKAVPILKKHNFPATIYLTTYYVEHQYPIPNLMADYMMRRGMFDCKIQKSSGNMRGSDQSSALHKSFLENMRNAKAQEENALLEKIAKEFGISYHDLVSSRLFHLLNPLEVKALADAGYDIQLHTHRHRNVVDNPDAISKEIQENIKVIKEITGKAARHFAYPSGRWDPKAWAALRECAVISAVTMDPGVNDSQSNPLSLRRIFDSENDHQLEFEWKVCGLKQIVYRFISRFNPFKGTENGENQ